MELNGFLKTVWEFVSITKKVDPAVSAAEAFGAACEAYRNNPSSENAQAVNAAGAEFARAGVAVAGQFATTPGGQELLNVFSTAIINRANEPELQQASDYLDMQAAVQSGKPFHSTGVDMQCGTLFTAAATYAAQNVATLVWEPLRRDPLTLDLDGDGIETHGISATNPIYFDHTGTGSSNPTGWISADDGFLVLDRNGDGLINNGTELFGDSTPLAGGGNALNGFHALLQEDTNSDGWVNQNDTRFGDLRVWRDLNQNGVSESGELQTLSALNITALRVDATANFELLDNGNVLADVGSFIRSDGSTATNTSYGDAIMVQSGTYTRTDGSTGSAGSFILAQNNFASTFTPLTTSAEAMALPDIQGSGWVRDLREAANDVVWGKAA